MGKNDYKDETSFYDDEEEVEEEVPVPEPEPEASDSVSVTRLPSGMITNK